MKKLLTIAALMIATFGALGQGMLVVAPGTNTFPVPIVMAYPTNYLGGGLGVGNSIDSTSGIFTFLDSGGSPADMFGGSFQVSSVFGLFGGGNAVLNTIAIPHSGSAAGVQFLTIDLGYAVTTNTVTGTNTTTATGYRQGTDGKIAVRGTGSGFDGDGTLVTGITSNNVVNLNPMLASLFPNSLSNGFAASLKTYADTSSQNATNGYGNPVNVKQWSGITTNAFATGVAALSDPLNTALNATNGLAANLAVTIANVTNNSIVMRGPNNLSEVTSPGTAAKTLGAYAGSFNLGMHPNLVGWWEARYLVQNEGDQVTSYPDRSGQGHNGSVAAGSQAPIYHTNKINGLPALSYLQSASTKMTIPSFFDSSFNHAFTIFEIRHATKTNASLMISSVETSGNWYSGVSTALIGQYEDFVNNGNTKYDGTIVDPFAVQVVSFRYGSDYAELRVNGVRVYYIPNPPNFNCSGDFIIGSRPGFENLCWEGELAATAIFKEAMSETDLAQIENALSLEYNTGIGNSLLAFDGASLTMGQGVVAWGDYPFQVFPLVGGSNQWSAVNLAITGKGSDFILTNMVTAILPRIPGHKTIYLNWSGDNNLFAGSPAATCVSNTFACLDLAAAAGADTVAFTILPGNRGPTWETNRLLFNAILRSNWTAHAKYLCDVGADPILGNSNNFSNPTYWQADGVHLTALSYGIVASNYVSVAINSLSRGPGFVGTNYAPTVISTNFIGNLAAATNLLEAGLTLADNATNNASTTAHGFLKKLDGNAAHYQDGTGNWSTPAGGGSATYNNNNLTNTGTVIQFATNPQMTNPIVTGVIGVTNSTSTDPVNITGTLNNYFEGFIQNLSAGTLASTDWVLGNDLSSNTDTNHILDLFINSSGYTGGIYGTNNDAGMAGGLFVTNVYVIAQATNGHIRLAVGGQYPTNTVADFTTNGVTITNNVAWTGVATGNGSGITTLNASSLASGTVPAAQMPAFTGDITTSAGAVATTLKNTGTAGTYFRATYDAQGRETSGSNPTTIAGFGITDAVSTNGPTIFGPTMLPLAGASNSIVVTNAGVLIQSITNNPGITLSNFTDTGSSAASAIDVRGTWNTSATPLPFIYVSFTNTASAGTANVLEIDSSSTPMLRLNRAGLFTVAGGVTAGGALTGTTLNGTGNATITSGDVIVATVGRGLQIKGGSNAKIGTATLASGTVTVSTTAVTASSQIFLTVKVVGGTGVGIPTVGTVSAGTSFIINSLIPGGVLTQTLDNSQISWMIVEQN